MPTVTVVMPVYGVERFVADAVRSVLTQAFTHFELIIVDDVSPDASIAICRGFDDRRIRIVRHDTNRGLAAARNTGIRHARGRYLAFLDSDDFWHAEKLARHVAHLDADPGLGLSFSRSAFVDADGNVNGCYQMPRLAGITPEHLLCRNPVGNGSAPVLRRTALEALAYRDPSADHGELMYFDERLRRSEDIECWMRLALTKTWRIEGLNAPLTFYRLNAGGLSADLLRQLESWEQVAAKLRGLAPELMRRTERRARAYQLRYLSRQAIRLGDGPMAARLLSRALVADHGIAFAEPSRTFVTAAAACALCMLPRALQHPVQRLGQRAVGALQALRIGRESAMALRG